MRFLLDTSVCSVYLKDERRLFSRFQQHAGQLCTSSIVFAELYVWAFDGAGNTRLDAIANLASDLNILEFDDQCALVFGKLRADLRSRGINVPVVDMLIAATAIVHDCTLITNDRHFQQVPGLALEDWLT